MTSEPEKLRQDIAIVATGQVGQHGMTLDQGEVELLHAMLSSPVSGSDIDYVAMVDWASRFHDENDSGYGADTRKWCRALHAALSASPTPPIPMIAEAGEREDLGWRLERIIEDGGPLTLSDKAVLREAVATLTAKTEKADTPTQVNEGDR